MIKYAVQTVCPNSTGQTAKKVRNRAYAANSDPRQPVCPNSVGQTAPAGKKPAESVKLADQVNTNPHALQTRGTAQKHLIIPQHTLLHI